MTENFPYASVDYFSKKFKPTDLSIRKEKIRKSEARHYRNEIEYIIILSGSAEIEINHTIFSIGQGDFIQLMPYHVNKLLINEKSSIELYRIRFSIGLLLLISTDKTRYLNAIKNIDKSIPIASLDEQASNQVEFLCESVYNEKQKTNDNIDVLHISLVSYLSYFANKNRQVPLKEKGVQRDSIWKILEYIQIHHQEQLTLQVISKELELDENQIKNNLKELTGFRFHYLLNQVRIRNAVALFQFEDLSINQIGKVCGYQTEAYFYKIFKEIIGVTPLTYRKEIIGKTYLKNSYDAWEVAIYILENCRKELSLDEVASTMNLSKKKLNHLLSTTFNVTFRELLNHFRVQIGKTFLVSLGLSVQEVALMVGFTDATTFIRNFKVVYGMTPKQFQLVKGVKQS